MGQVKGKGKNYTPLELLKLAVFGTIDRMVSPPEVKKAKDEWRISSGDERRQAIDDLIYETLAGVGGSVKMSGPVKKSASIIGHILSDTTKKQLAKGLGSVSRDMDIVGKDLVNELAEAYKIESGFVSKLRSMFISTAPLSPETIYALERSGAGRKIYRTIDLADQGMNKFMVREVNQFQKALGNIKAGSDSSRRVGRVLDGKLPEGQLKGQEVELYKFLKKKFDFLINQYAKTTLNDDKVYRRLAHAASVDKSNKPMVLVKDLSKKLTNEYNYVVGRLNKKVGGKAFKDMSSKEKKLVGKVGKTLKGIRHKGWIEELGGKEKEVFSLLSRKIKNYLPHIFDKDELLKGFSIEKELLEESLKLSTRSKEITKIKRRLVSINNSIVKLKGGELVTYEQLPQNIRFKFFDTRKGAKGYSFDAAKAYEVYVRGMSKKLFQEPALKKVGVLYKDLDPVMKRYTKQHVKDWIGMGQSGAMDLANAITTTQWMLKLGINPRSAITNMAQRVNTVAAVGEGNALKGYLKGWTKEGNRLFNETGLAQEVPSVLLEGQIPAKMMWMKDKLGYLFTKVELGNRKHAFLSGLEEGKKMGLTGQELTQHGIDVVHKTQFRYGSVGMPAPLRTASGKVMFQFWSYPIKQVEFLVKMLKNNPKGLARWVLYAEGGRQALKKGGGIDLGNALGLGLNYEEVKNTLSSLSDGELEGAFRHAKLAVQGGGLVPGLSPTFGAMVKIGEGLNKGLMPGLRAAGREATPVQAQKITKGVKALEGVQEVDGEKRYPWKNSRGETDIYLSGPELFSETLGPKTVALKELSAEKSKDFSYKRLDSRVKQEARELFTEGSSESILKAIKLMNSIGAEVSDEQIEGGVVRSNVPYRERKELERTDQERVMRLLNP